MKKLSLGGEDSVNGVSHFLFGRPVAFRAECDCGGIPGTGAGRIRNADQGDLTGTDARGHMADAGVVRDDERGPFTECGIVPESGRLKNSCGRTAYPDFLHCVRGGERKRQPEWR